MVLHYTGRGTDYTTHYSDQPATIWLESYLQKQLEFASSQNMKCARLGMQPQNYPNLSTTKMSTYNKDKMKEVVSIFAAKGQKVIILLQNIYGSGKNYVGSPEFDSFWLQVARDFQGDNRVAAFSLFGEPDHSSTYNTWHSSITTTLQFQQHMMNLTRQIQAIDPNRKVIFPFLFFNGKAYPYDGADELIADLKAVGFDQNPNVIIDVDHPYFFENSWDGGSTPNGVAARHEDMYIKPLVAAFGADKCYIGESFAWWGEKTIKVSDGTGGKDPTRSLQVEWMKEFINMCVRNKISFNIWADYGTISEKIKMHNEAIAASNWNSSLVTVPEPQPEPQPPLGGGDINFFRAFVVGLRDYFNNVIDSWEK